MAADFQKRHYEFIASEIIATRQKLIGVGADVRALDLFTDCLAERFRYDNPRFDALRFARRIHEEQR